MTDYLVYDVFTDRPFGGNQLAILPDARALDEADLQRIAREFNFSETTFVLPPETRGHSARVRIFTTTEELPFAGHPTIGTAIALAELRGDTDMVLELGVGPIPCRCDGNRAEFDTEQPLRVLGTLPDQTAAACLSLEPACIRGPVEIATLGLPFVFAELDSPDALARASGNLAAHQQAAADHPDIPHFAIFAWVDTGAGLRARMFAPLLGVPEDPATGSACATLGAMLTARRKAPQRLSIAQGVEMGRPSQIDITTQGNRVTVAGQAVKVMTGTLNL